MKEIKRRQNVLIISGSTQTIQIILFSGPFLGAVKGAVRLFCHFQTKKNEIYFHAQRLKRSAQHPFMYTGNPPILDTLFTLQNKQVI